MPILMGFAAAYDGDRDATSRKSEARGFVDALLAPPADVAIGNAALDRFADWAAGWLAAKNVRDPIFYPLPAPEATEAAPAQYPSARLAAAVARKLARPNAGQPILRWSRESAPPAEPEDADALRPRLRLCASPAQGTPVLVGDVYRSEALLRACALALNDAGAKPMFALFAARTAAGFGDDRFEPGDLSFSVRP